MKTSNYILYGICILFIGTWAVNLVKDADLYALAYEKFGERDTLRLIGKVEEDYALDFKHVVVDYPGHKLYAHYHPSFSGVSFRSNLDGVKLEDLVDLKVKSDTLYIKGKMDLNQQLLLELDGKENNYATLKTRNPNSSSFPFLLSIRSPALKSVTLKPNTEQVLYLKPTLMDLKKPNTWNPPLGDSIDLQADFKIVQFGATSCTASMHHNSVIVNNLEQTNGGNKGEFKGSINHLSLINPAGKYNGITNYLTVLANQKWTYGRVDFKVEEHLDAVLQSKNSLIVIHESENPITIKKEVNAYGLVISKAHIQ